MIKIQPLSGSATRVSLNVHSILKYT